MDHDDVRAMLSAGEETPEAESHLKTCRECRAWGESLARVRTFAVETSAPPAPVGLADRALAAVRAAAEESVRPAVTAPAVTAPAVTAPAVAAMPRWWRRVGGRAAIAGGIAAAVVAAAVAIPRSGRPTVSEGVLVAAAKSTAAAKTARVELSGSMKATFKIDLGEIAKAMQSAFPDGGSDQALQSLPPEFRRAAQEQMQKVREQMAAEMQRRRREMSKLAAGITIEMEMSGTGEAVFPDRLHLRGTITPKGPLPMPGGPFELIAVGDDAWIKAPWTEGKWVKIPANQGPFQFTFKPESMLEAMSKGRNVEDLGEEIVDGRPARHYRVRQSQGVPSPGKGSGTATTDFWIGVEDQVLRKAVFSANGRASEGSGSGEFSSAGSMHLYDFGADVSVSPPPADQVSTRNFERGGFGVGMGGAGFSFSFNASSAMASSRSSNGVPSGWPSAYPSAYPAFTPPPPPSAYPSPPPTVSEPTPPAQP